MTSTIAFPWPLNTSNLIHKPNRNKPAQLSLQEATVSCTRKEILRRRKTTHQFQLLHSSTTTSRLSSTTNLEQGIKWLKLSHMHIPFEKLINMQLLHKLARSWCPRTVMIFVYEGKHYNSRWYIVTGHLPVPGVDGIAPTNGLCVREKPACIKIHKVTNHSYRYTYQIRKDHFQVT